MLHFRHFILSKAINFKKKMEEICFKFMLGKNVHWYSMHCKVNFFSMKVISIPEHFPKYLRGKNNINRWKSILNIELLHTFLDAKPCVKNVGSIYSCSAPFCEIAAHQYSTNISTKMHMIILNLWHQSWWLEAYFKTLRYNYRQEDNFFAVL